MISKAMKGKGDNNLQRISNQVWNNIQDITAVKKEVDNISTQNTMVFFGGSTQYAGRIYALGSISSYNTFSLNWDSSVGTNWDRSPVSYYSRYGGVSGYSANSNYSKIKYLYTIHNYNTFTTLLDGDIFVGLARLTDDGSLVPILESERPVPALNYGEEVVATLSGEFEIDISIGDRFSVYLYTASKEVRDIRYKFDWTLI